MSLPSVKAVVKVSRSQLTQDRAAPYMTTPWQRYQADLQQDGFSHDSAQEQAVLLLECEGPGEKIQSPVEDESYTLRTKNGMARIQAANPLGILRGIETFLQLVVQDEAGFCVPGIAIQDQPRFPWRGLLIDSGRHWLPLEVIKRNLDGMAAVKLNT